MTKYHFKDHKDFPREEKDVRCACDGYNSALSNCANLSIELDEEKVINLLMKDEMFQHVHDDYDAEPIAKILAANLPDLIKENN